MSDLQIRIGADIQDFNKKLATAVANIQNFDAVTRAAIDSTNRSFKSVDQLTDRLDRLSKALKSATDPKVFSGLQVAIDVTKKRIELLNGSVGGGLASSSNKGAYALSNLSRIAQDAPFGFIAIQNNITPLFDSFTQLSKDSGGTVNAFKALGSALAGPAGVAFLIGSLTSVITGLIQKYGSLGNALNALLGIQSKYNAELVKGNKSYNDYNDAKRTSLQISDQEAASASGNIQRVKSLVAIIGDVTKSYEERKNAQEELKNINKDFFGNLDIEKTKFSDLKSTVDLYIQSLQQAAVVKGFEQAISSTSVELAKQKDVLSKLKTELDDIAKQPKKLIGKADIVDTRLLDEATARFIAQQKVVDDLQNTLNLYNTELDNGVKKQNEILAPINAANKALADQKEAEEKAAKAAQDAAEKARIARQKLVDDYLAARKKMLANRMDDAAFIPIINTDRINYEESVKKFKDLYNRINKDAFEEAAKTQGTVKGGIQVYPSENVQRDINNLKAVQEKSQQYLSLLSPIIDNVFSAIENGQNAFKALGQSVKAFALELVKALLKTAALAALISIFSGGKISFGTAFKGISTVNGGLIGLGGAAAPSIGSMGGMSGGLQLGGQVVFVQRGYDLVGVLNASNGSINNIG